MLLPRHPLTWLLLLLAAPALAACCGSVACDNRADALDDALVFRFNLDSTTAQGFRAAQLRTVYVRRVPLDTAQRPRADTVALTARRQLVPEVVLNNAQPFAQSGTRKLDQYTYEIYLGTRRAPTTRYALTQVQLRDGLTRTIAYFDGLVSQGLA